ncbi:DEAD/DEAH box helicase [Mameliella sediminis]|uniref:DEAD/DEAH box helicase n=1 Tax=Mameliella sediminis TaxID=2836866 RepID=UPI001C45005E|nr:DEAD/DEAH box helicase [Mameliella sediminis]
MKQALRDALDDRGYDSLTPVQEAVLAPELESADLLVSAQTGSGKTLGFGLAVAPTLLKEAEVFDEAAAPLALVIAPTRELALQVKRELGWLYAKAGAVVTSCVGGMDMRDERRALARGAHIVVATPGRLRDHIMRETIDLSHIRAVVLDEADEMLDLGFREDLEFILGEAPEERQTLLFSATVPNAIAQLAKSYQRDAIRVVAKSETQQHADITYRAMMVAEGDTENAVINTLRYYEAPNAIVFANTRAMVNRLTTRLSNRGFHVVALSGELSQAERSHALQAMRDGRAQVCVATDVAARGIDLPNLDLVVHAELPNNHETLLHRSGRTGRAGRKGVSALVVTRKSRKKAERILGWAKLKAEWCDAPSAAEVRARDEDRLFADPEWQEPVPESDREMVDKLVAAFTPEQLGAAYLRLVHSQRSAPEELADVDAKREPRKEFGPSVWFAVEGGRNAGAEPRRILPMICKAGGLSKDDIGAIRVRPDQSLVQIRESSVASFLQALGPEMKLREGEKVTQLDEAPAMEPRPDRKPGFKKRDGQDRPDRSEKPRPHRKAPREAETDTAPAATAPAAEPPKSPARKPAPRDRAPSTEAKPARKERPFAADPSVRADRPARKRDDRPGGGPDKPRRPGKPGGSEAPRRGPGDRKKEGFGDRAGKPGRTPKGPPPPAGKPNSKKNKARAAAAKSEGASFRPKRNKP